MRERASRWGCQQSFDKFDEIHRIIALAARRGGHHIARMQTTHAPTLLALSFIAIAAATGCTAETAAPESESNATSTEQDLVAGRSGAVYTLGNDASSNEVIVFRRSADGSLQRASSHATGGKGSGDGLGSQGALTLAQDRHWLYAVNAGSDELSVFYVAGEQLYLVDCVPTGGARPISVTVHGNVAYVLHAGRDAAPGSIRGFRLGLSTGRLSPIAGSSQPLSGAAVGPAQVSFSPSGRALLVTEKGTNLIDEYRVDGGGRASAAVVHASTGTTPFGFAITQRGQAIVSEAFGGGADAGAVSSYQLGSRAGLAPISGSIANTESAPCWVVLAKNDRYAYVSNTASDSVSTYRVALDGAVSLIGADGRAADTGEGSKPIDMALSRNDSDLYVLDSGTAQISGFHVGTDGSLTPAGTTAGLPATAVGLAAY